VPGQMKAGDILIELEGGGAEHIIMWVGGDKPIVHSAEQESFVGVIQQSAKPYLIKKDDEKKWKPFVAVFRSDSESLAAQAAKFAIEWATRSDDEVYMMLRTLEKEGIEEKIEEYKKENPRVKRFEPGKKNVTIGSPKFGGDTIVLDTPFSQERLGGGDKDWDVYSLFRALRAYDRVMSQLPLSQLKGITCSQFVTYCYQAAALHGHFGGSPIPKEILNLISDNGKLYSLKKTKESQPDLISNALEGFDVGFMPVGMLVDAKTTSADNLMEKLLDSKSGFQEMGYMVPKGDEAVLISISEASGIKTWGDLKELLK